MSSTRTGARDSMPSTAMPSAILPSSSPSSGWCLGEGRGPLPYVVGQQQLAAGRRPQAVLGDLQGALVGDLEVADLLDVVAPELHPQRVLLGGREDVQDAAAHGELAALLDQLHAGVRGGRERLDDLVQVGGLPGAQRHRLQVAEALDLRLEHGADGRDDDRDRAGRRVVGARVGQAAQHGEAAADGVAARARAARAAASPRTGTPRRRPAGSSERRAAARSSASRPVAVTASTGRPVSRASAAIGEGAGRGRADQVDVHAVAVGGGRDRFREGGVLDDGVEQTVQAHAGLSVPGGGLCNAKGPTRAAGRGSSRVRRRVRTCRGVTPPVDRERGCAGGSARDSRRPPVNGIRLGHQGLPPGPPACADPPPTRSVARPAGDGARDSGTDGRTSPAARRKRVTSRRGRSMPLAQARACGRRRKSPVTSRRRVSAPPVCGG